MPTSQTDAARRLRAVGVRALTSLLASFIVLGGCAAPSPTRTPSPSLGGTPSPTATPEPTPLPTPLFSNTPDPELVALIPTEVAGRTVQIPPITEFAYTPGDIGQVYGEVGLRFETLQVAYIPQPRLSLFAMRMNAPHATTAGLEPYLAEAGRYVGIAGLHRDPWKLEAVGNHVVWWRPEDNATLKGTRVYTWALDGLVFLMIGVDEAQNLAMLAALPGEPAPTPTQLPSASGSPSIEPSAPAS
ncbi:MAG: hypothetical protein M3P32_04855 [Chloroflexota bacterium]|nr:hypothetical protein [Chloroflexota bacterium]